MVEAVERTWSAQPRSSTIPANVHLLISAALSSGDMTFIVAGRPRRQVVVGPAMICNEVDLPMLAGMILAPGMLMISASRDLRPQAGDTLASAMFEAGEADACQASCVMSIKQPFFLWKLDVPAVHPMAHLLSLGGAALLLRIYFQMPA